MQLHNYKLAFFCLFVCRNVSRQNGIIVIGLTTTDRHSFKTIYNFQVRLKFEASLLPFPVRLSKVEILSRLRAAPETN